MTRVPFIVTALTTIIVTTGSQATDLTMRRLETVGTTVAWRNSDVEGLTFAGRATWRSIGGNNRFGDREIFDTFGLDLTSDQTANMTDVEYNFTEMSGASLLNITAGQAAALTSLTRNHWNDAVTGSLAEAIAFQVAMWEIVHETKGTSFGALSSGTPMTGLSVNGGAFIVSADPNVMALADVWLADLTNDGVATEVFGFVGDGQISQVSTDWSPRQNWGGETWLVTQAPVSGWAPGSPSASGSGSGGRPRDGAETLTDDWIAPLGTMPTDDDPAPTPHPQSQSIAVVPLPATGPLALLGLMVATTLRRRWVRR